MDIGPVHHLEEKLRLFAQHFSRSGATVPPPHLFIPKQDPDGTATLTRHALAVAELESKGLKVHAVSSLREATQRLGFNRLARDPRENRLRLGLLSISAAALLFVLTAAWLKRPISLSFATIATTQGQIVTTPARALTSAGGALELLPPCTRASAGPAHLVGERLAIKIDSVAESWPAVYGVVASVSPNGGAQIQSLPRPQLNDAQATTFSVDLLPPAEDNLLVVLAQRLRPWDATALQAELQAVLMPLQATERLSAARNWLSRQGSGHLEYLFRTLPDGAC
ncbi:hypothetical protein [Polycyclovorans algicola]|uniref:hypothetical protein n=1 Tax=Polycyclovorans algicola TaxID=616992 RepID=UPI00137661DD|nr:hypothetical protein [Polycyclovorans algicola]